MCVFMFPPRAWKLSRMPFTGPPAAGAIAGGIAGGIEGGIAGSMAGIVAGGRPLPASA